MHFINFFKQEFESKNSSTTLGSFEKLVKQNLEAKNEVLSYLEKKFKDVGPASDCVVFHDGTMWRLVFFQITFFHIYIFI